jgi:hypothetical protein
MRKNQWAFSSGREQLFHSLLISLSLSPMTPLRGWPLGYFDKYGEITYTEAATAIGCEKPAGKTLDQLLKEGRKSPTNLIVWKMAADAAFSDGRQEKMLELWRAIDSSSASKSMQSLNRSYSGFSYAWTSIRERIIDSGTNENRKKWAQVLDKLPYDYFAGLNNKEKWLFQFSILDGDPVALRKVCKQSTAARFFPFEAKYLEGLSYLTSVSNGKDTNEHAEIDVNKAIQIWKDLAKAYPTEPTVYFLLSRFTNEKESVVKSSYARKYLELEKRSFKAEWRDRAKAWIK